jgi:anti-anti-sigma factor
MARRKPIDVELSPSRGSGYAAIVMLCGEHDITTGGALRVALAPLYGNVLVDLSECDFIDSSVIGALLEKSEDLRHEGRRIELVVPAESSRVRRSIEVIGLENRLGMHERRPDAEHGPERASRRSGPDAKA